MNCKNCGTIFKEKQNFCTKCGIPLSDVVLNTEENYNEIKIKSDLEDNLKSKLSTPPIPNNEHIETDNSIINENKSKIETSLSNNSSEMFYGVIFGLISVVVLYAPEGMLFERGLSSFFACLIGGGFVMVGVPLLISVVIKIFKTKSRFSLIFMSVSLIINILFIFMTLNKPTNPYE
jgi:hypothetical protein